MSERLLEQSSDPGSDVVNAALFLTRWAKNPLQMGSVVPSFPALCPRVARHIRRAPDEAVIEPPARA